MKPRFDKYSTALREAKNPAEVRNVIHEVVGEYEIGGLSLLEFNQIVNG